MLLVVQAVVVAVVTAFLVYEDVAATAASGRGAVFVTVYAAATATAFGLLGWALGRRRAWARGPAVVLELMLLPIGYYMITGGVPWFGIPVVLLGLFGAGLLVAPATREALGVR